MEHRTYKSGEFIVKLGRANKQRVALLTRVGSLRVAINADDRLWVRVAGDKGDSMFFIKQGMVAIILPDKREFPCSEG